MKRFYLIAALILFVLVTQAQAARFYSVKRTNITTTSVPLTFTDRTTGEAFSSNRVNVYTDPANSDEVCVNWTGGIAVCPSGNVAGDDRIPAGTSVFFDDFPTGQVSVIAASGTQVVTVRAVK